MTIRFKFIAAALGLALALGAVADANANTVVKKTVATHAIHAKTSTKIVAGQHHRIRFGTRIVKHVRIAHRAPLLVKVAQAPVRKVVVTKTVGMKTVGTKVVRVTKAPLVRHAMFHRAGAKVTVVR